MRKTAQDALTKALKEINATLKVMSATLVTLTNDIRGIRVALATREEDFEERNKVIVLEMTKHTSQIKDLQRKLGGAR